MKSMKKGFTIVELVIVIAVIAILAAVLIPTFSGVIQKSNKSAALQEATSVMKSTLAMSDSGTLSDGTIFAIGDKDGVKYEFNYTGNKINESTATDLTKATLTATGSTTVAKGKVQYNRVIVSSNVVNGTEWKDADKVQAIIKDVFGSAPSALESSTTSGAYAQFSVTVDKESVKVQVYVNSDYPTDVVTFVPATQK